MTITARELGVASIGDPRSTATWSGTARNLTDALERNGLRVVPLDCQAPMGVRLPHFGNYALRLGVSLALAGRRPRLPIDPALVFGRSDFLRSAGMRKRHGGLLHDQIHETGVREVLHLSNLSIPIEDDGLEHYLFCDSTWHTLTNDVLGHERRVPSLWHKFEEAEMAVNARVSHFFVTSQHVSGDLVAHYGVDSARVTVVGSGMGQVSQREGERAYMSREVLFVARGRFEEKGGPLLVEAFRSVSRRLPDAQLTLVGDPRYEDWFRDTSGVSGRGRVSDSELEALFDRSSLFAMPALVEPWGLVYLEALLRRVPVLGLRRQAFPEIAGDGRYGIIIDEPNPDSVADAIVSALTQPDQLRRMGQAGQDRCLREFSWDIVAQRMINLVAPSEPAHSATLR